MTREKTHVVCLRTEHAVSRDHRWTASTKNMSRETLHRCEIIHVCGKLTDDSFVYWFLLDTLVYKINTACDHNQLCYHVLNWTCHV